MFKKLLQKLFGRYLEKKAGLYDGTPTDGKVWYRSTTVLAGIYTTLRALYEGISAVMVMSGKPKLPDVPEGLDAIVGSLLGATIIRGRVNANQPIIVNEDKSPKNQTE